MQGQILVGPLLGLEGNETYTLCFLTSGKVETAEVLVDGGVNAAALVAYIPDGRFWRAEIQVPPPGEAEQGKRVQYEVHLDGVIAGDGHGRTDWTFYVPSIHERPKLAYASCNGVSKADLITTLGDPFALWRQMADLHREKPFSLLIMGGDQVYADSIWDKVKALEDWSSLKLRDQVRKKPTKDLSRQLDRFYSKLYRQRWSDEHMSYMLASVPTLSGDVHVGCLGVVNDSRHGTPVKVHQVVSSGVVHPAPTLMQWLGISAVTNDEVETINEERTIEASMLKPVGAKRYIRTRNFVTLEEGTDAKLWVNWITEESEEPETAEHPLYPISSSPTV